jgi:hypothetical protein
LATKNQQNDTTRTIVPEYQLISTNEKMSFSAAECLARLPDFSLPKHTKTENYTESPQTLPQGTLNIRNGR